MLSILASGTMVRDPEHRTSAAGKPYATGSLRVPTDGEEAAFASLIAFNESAVKALLAHAKGDAVAVAGRGKFSTWTGKGGAEKHGLSIVVERLLSPYQLDKRRSRVRSDQEGAERERVAPVPTERGTAPMSTATLSAAGGLVAMHNDIP